MVIGGYQGSSHGTSGTEIINEEKEMRCNIRSYPYALNRHSTTIIPTGILVCGGYSSSQQIHRNKCHQYKQSTSSWHSFPSMTTRRYHFDMKYLNQGVWAIGGSINQYISQSYEYHTTIITSMDYFNMTSNLWTRRSLPINGVAHHCLAQISEYKLILLGGYQSGYGVSEL